MPGVAEADLAPPAGAPDGSEATARIAAFAARVAPLGVRVERVASSAEAAQYLATLRVDAGAPRLTIAGEVASAAPNLIAALTEAGVPWRIPATVEEARDAPLGVSLAKLAVEETGSFLLNEPSLADRAVGLISKLHVALVPVKRLVPSLADAAPVLREIAQRPGGGYASFITGPSRTADIELSLTIGVQGPEAEIVLFVDRLE
ncbi:MAG: lactate utilization protein C [Thermomicrobiales bacterium]|nr:MAG: lactate utilization protein C [Thermomicrobiales bacterium]